MRRKTVPEQVHGDPFIDLGIGCGGNNGTRQLTVADRVDRVLSGEQPATIAGGY
jgi:hypothetical protein